MPKYKIIYFPYISFLCKKNILIRRVFVRDIFNSENLIKYLICRETNEILDFIIYISFYFTYNLFHRSIMNVVNKV